MTVRQAALVTSGAEGQAARSWVAGVPGLAVSASESFDALPWSRTELVWVHGVVPAPLPLHLADWIRRGGRLLLTQEATRLPFLLGLDARAPEYRPPVPDGMAYRGFAGFGSHPLFDGLSQGALTAYSTAGAAASSFRSARPESGQVVAVEHQARQLDTGHVVAWEYEVGDGGALCLGAFASLAEQDPLARRQLERLLRNALVGEAIPHSTRRAATLWPGSEPLAESPPAPPPPAEVWDEWPPSTSPLLVESHEGGDAAWRLAGRRALLSGTERHGLADIVVLPRRVAHGFRLEVNGRIPEVMALRIAPDEVTRVLRAGEVELTERVCAALDHGVVFWGVVADAPVTIRLRWKTDLGRAWPYPLSRDPLLVASPAAGEPGNGRVYRVGLPREAARFEVAALAGEIAGALSGDSGGAVRFDACGERILRLVFAAGSDEAELNRATDALRRRKLRAFRQDRVLQVRRIEERLVALDSPDPALDRLFAWAKMRIEDSLAETPGVGRGILAEAAGAVDLVEGPAYRAIAGSEVAAAALALGNRDLSRDQLRFLARMQTDSGAIPAAISPSGMADLLAPDAAGTFVALAEQYLRWTGDRAFLEALEAPLAAARGMRPAPEPLPTLPPPGWPLPVRFAELAPGNLPAAEAAAVVRWVVERLWGVAPDSGTSVLRLAPELPPGWGEMSLRRLRVGPTTLDLRIRRRPGRTVLLLERVAGPPLRVVYRPPAGGPAGSLTVDEVPLGGSEAAFLLEGTHEVMVGH